ncbi:hypothetical protein ACLB2K_060690 [Fragaria x ananassa]
MQTNIKKIVNLEDLAAGHNKRRIIQNAISNEFCRMLDPGKPSFTPKKGKPKVVMFVGLQGLKQNATKVKIPFYGSYMESDPVKIATEGVETFKKENCDLIIVDTSGRHKQEAALFEEMRQVAEATKPDLDKVVRVSHQKPIGNEWSGPNPYKPQISSIGQAAFDQAQAFKQSAAVGAVIVTKMDGHPKGGGALSVVAATKSPVIFIGTGKHMDEFEAFNVKRFVSHLLGLGDLSGFMDKIQEVAPKLEKQPELLQKLSERTITLRFMYELVQNMLQMGPLSQLTLMLLGADQFMPKEYEQSPTSIDVEDDGWHTELDEASKFNGNARRHGQEIDIDDNYRDRSNPPKSKNQSSEISFIHGRLIRVNLDIATQNKPEAQDEAETPSPSTHDDSNPQMDVVNDEGEVIHEPEPD